MSIWIPIGLALVAQAATVDAPPDAAAAREADMFGETPADAPPAPLEGETPSTSSSPTSADREADMFGAADTPATLTPGVLSAPGTGLLAERDNALALGGQLFLRLNSSFREGSGLNDGTIVGPSLLDTFADVRPNDRVRAYAQLRFNFDYTVLPGEKNFLGVEQQPFTLQLAQAWVKFDLGQVAYVTAGRQRIRWGTGRFWNPTDFINQEIRNSVDFFDQRVGVDLVKVHFPFEALGWNLYLIGIIGGVDVVKDTGLAARAEFVFGPAELALSSFVKDEAPLRFGADVSAGIWLFDVKAEGILSRGLGRKLFEGDLDFDAGELPTEVDTDGQWYFEGVVGAETQLKYTDTDTVALGAEYFYNQAGYASATIYPFLFLNGGFTPLYTGQHYVAVYASAPSPLQFNDLQLIVSTLGNLSDLSFLTRFDVQYTLLQYVTVNAFVVGHWGNVGEFKLGIDIPPLPVVPGLEDGFILENEAVDVGLALRMAF
jgi:hypothetical protein